MIVTKKALPRRTFLRGLGATLALPLLDAMVPALSALAETPASRARRLGFIYMPNGVAMNFSGMNYWTPTSEGRELRAVADPGAARAVREQMLVVSGLTHHQADALERRRQRRSRPRHEHVADRRAPQAHRRRRRPQRHLGRSDRRAGARARTRALPSLELGVDLNYLVGQLRERLQLRVHEHAGVEHADHAAADREQSARRVRAAVRRRRHGRAAACCAPGENRSILDSVHGGPGAPAGPARSRAIARGQRLRRLGARGRAANPERRGARRKSSCRRSNVRPAFRNGSTSTSA